MKPAKAHGLVFQAIKAGTLRRHPCEVCGSENVHAHHDDYERPLDVRWLCPHHHRLHHRGEYEPPIMVRASITRDELKQLRLLALANDQTVQAYVGDIIRERIAKEAA